MSTIKVEVKKLITEFEKEKTLLLAQHKQDLEEYEKKKKLYMEELAATLEITAKKIRQGKFKLDQYGWNRLSLPEGPQKPHKSNRICELDSRIKLLKLSANPMLSVSENSEYAKFICAVDPYRK